MSGLRLRDNIKSDLKKWDKGVWTEITWFTIGTNGGMK
jgi:hypothetical protein